MTDNGNADGHFDSRGNASPRSTLQISVEPSTAGITKANLTTTTNNALAGQPVDFTANNGATLTTVIGTTGADGIATATLTNTKAGVSLVTATVNGKDQMVNTLFIVDHSTATIADADFTVGSGAAENTEQSNALKAVVKDGKGNLVSGITVTFAVTSGSATLTIPSVETSVSGGVAQTTLKSLVSGDNKVTASVNGPARKRRTQGLAVILTLP